MLSREYGGARDFLALGHCLAYGKESILEKRPTEETMIMSDPLKSHWGTPQCWKLEGQEWIVWRVHIEEQDNH